MKQGIPDRILKPSKRMLLIAATTIFCSTAAFANDPRDATGSDNNPVEALIERPEGAYIDSFSNDFKQHYNLAIGAMQKVNGTVRPESERVVDANVTRLIYRIPSSVPLVEAYEGTRRQLAEQAEVVWECQSRECGPSDYWAYSQYNSSKLYGLDDTQRYSLFEDASGYWLMHGIQRGNKRVYLLIERIVTKVTPVAEQGNKIFPQALSPAELLVSAEEVMNDEPITDMTVVKNRLTNGGVWTLGGQLMPQTLVDYLIEEDKQIWLLVEARHSSLDQSMRLSQDYLDQITEQLTVAGLDSQHINAIAAGAIDLVSTQTLKPSGVRAFLRVSDIADE